MNQLCLRTNWVSFGDAIARIIRIINRLENILDFLYQYGLFLAQALTIVIAIVVVLVTIVGLSTKGKPGQGHLEITNISESITELVKSVKEQILSKDQFKALEKSDKKQRKKTKIKKTLLRFAQNKASYENKTWLNEALE